MLSEFFQKSPENSQTLGPMLCSEYLELGIVSCCAVVVEPFHGGPPKPPLRGDVCGSDGLPPRPPLYEKKRGGVGGGLFFEAVVELFDFVDDTMLFKELVLFVIDISHQCQGRLAKTRAFHE